MCAHPANIHTNNNKDTIGLYSFGIDDFSSTTAVSGVIPCSHVPSPPLLATTKRFLFNSGEPQNFGQPSQLDDDHCGAPWAATAALLLSPRPNVVPWPWAWSFTVTISWRGLNKRDFF